ncbi:MAG: BatA and WFA domain-containing protein [Planctomycetaceae bacterium]|nr:BatA and WFA domain-containing protein [Planctomycetaceae bacterium]MCA9044172.1 BatA and WFA domain-containing protein [Planctomycetaceae bacterium]MCB9952290.1 BatA domain-containing protein [Planctomycetaceae bacterium]
MSWLPQFFAPSYWWLFLLLIPLVIVYFLKLRRTRMAIPSLALWQQVVNDQRVNSPFQRFKRNLLLLLQILILLLLVFSVMQPYFAGTESNALKLPILIDCSASMGARDESGKSRLDIVKEEVLEIVNGLPPGTELTLIEVGASARRVTDFTDNKVVLREALEEMAVSDVASRLEDGLRLAQALTRSTDQIESVRLYTDGNLPTKMNPATGKPMAAIDFDLSFPIEFFPIDPAGRNMGITSFNARRTSTERWDVFVRVESDAGGGSDGKVTLYSNGEMMGEERVVLEAGESQRLVFRVDTNTPHRLEAKLTVSGHDALQSDNTAWLTLPVGRRLKVFCPPELATYRHALMAMEEVALEPDAEGNTSEASYDLLISDDVSDNTIQATSSLFVGQIPEDLQQLVTIQEVSSAEDAEEVEYPRIVDWKRDATLLQHTQLKEVLISDSPVKGEGVEDGDIEREGYEILAYGNMGPLILRHQEGMELDYYILFQTDRSTLPYRVSFPIIVSNLVNEAMQQASLADLQAPPTGVLPPITLPARREVACRVTTPAGKHQERTTTEEGVLIGVSAPNVGEYEIRQEGELVEQVGVSLLNSTETSLATVDKIHFNELAVEAAPERKTTNQLWWRQLAMAALCVLLIEWWYFQKRPAGVPD